MKKTPLRFFMGMTVSASLLLTCGAALPSAIVKEVQPLPANIPDLTKDKNYEAAPAADPAAYEPTPGWEVRTNKVDAEPVQTPSVVTTTPNPNAATPAPYTMAWLDRYAPASVAPFSEQVGDNGQYPDTVNRPAAGTYELIVDYTNQCVYAFSKDAAGNRVLERVMICTTGGNGNWTPEGEYSMGSDYHRFGYFTSYNCYAQYWSQMWRSFYFHSVLYKEQDANTLTMSSYNNLGTPVSHGCIRLLVPDARWIYENCAPGTYCEVTTEYKKNPALKKALKYGYKGATDYTG